LSIICKSFNSNTPFSKYSLTSGMKRCWKHSVNNTVVTHALRLCCYKTGRILFINIFVLDSARIVRTVNTRLCCHIVPASVYPSMLQIVVPVLHFCEYRYMGIFLQNRSVSSQLKTCLGSYYPSLIIFFTRPETWQLLPQRPIRLFR